MLYSSVILIGGTDPSGGAGLPADSAILQSLRVRSRTVVTAVTAQNEKRFFSYQTISPKVFSDQLKAVTPFAKKAIIKIGMLANGNLVEILGRWFQKNKTPLVILDPVLRSSTGALLLDKAGIQKLLQKLLPQVQILTPNLPELEILSGRKILNAHQAINAAYFLFKKYPKLSVILLKGGHFPGKPVDYLIERKSNDTFLIKTFSASRIEKGYFHGTGCALASALAGNLVLGLKLSEAVREARKWVRKKIRHSF